MVGKMTATKPSRSDDVLDADEQERIANQIRAQFDSLTPKRPVKPNRSEPDPDASTPFDHFVASSQDIPEHLRLRSLQSQSHVCNDLFFLFFSFLNFSLIALELIDSQAVISEEGPRDVQDEFVETQYYKELTSIDKQHHTVRHHFFSLSPYDPSLC